MRLDGESARQEGWKEERKEGGKERNIEILDMNLNRKHVLGSRYSRGRGQK